MKNIIIISSLVLNLLGCTFQNHFLNSNVSGSFNSGKSFAEAILIKSQTSNFSIIAATENNSNTSATNHYILLAPNSYYTYSTKIDEVRIDLSSYLNLTEAELLIADLENVIQNWGLKNTNLEGDYYEFNSLPEKETLKISKQQTSWYSSIVFNYKKTRNNSAAILKLGPPEFRFIYEFKYKYEVVFFRQALIEAKEELSRKSEL